MDAVSHGSPLGNLAAAMKVAGLSRVDAWIGTGGEAGGPGDPSEDLRADHWDGLFSCDKFVLTPAAVTRDANPAVRSALGFADVQRFSRAVVDAIDEVASTSVGNDCGEGFAAPSAWSRAFALLEEPAFGRAPLSVRAGVPRSWIVAGAATRTSRRSAVAARAAWRSDAGTDTKWMAPRPGLEPGTCGLTVRRSTNCAIGEQALDYSVRPRGGSIHAATGR